jgi:acyl-CoA synthetase (AMP-forming)/AMP-acid ligase II
MAGTLPSILDLSSEIGSSSVAVRSWDGSFTYDELRQRVSDFANNLQAAGIGHGDPVGLCVEKSRLAVVAIVAILKPVFGTRSRSEWIRTRSQVTSVILLDRLPW